MNSFNHYSFGSCGEWMFDTMAGIAPLEPGYRRIRIAPLPGPGIDHVAASYDSIRGRIATEWRRQKDTLTLQVTIPPNTTAEIQLPRFGKGTVQSTPAVQARNPDQPRTLEVGSGTYAFRMQ
jgi:alpha-L-rhamnosidase